MASLKSLKIRKTSVQSSKKVTHAMKLVSASKLRKARETVEKSRNYMKIINRILDHISKEMTEEEKQKVYKNFPLLFGRNSQKYLFIAIGSDRGLCGAFNNNVVKETKIGIAELLKENKQILVLCIGERVYRELKDVTGVEVKQLTQQLKTIQEIKDFAKDLVAKFNKLEFDACKIYYTTFLSPIAQKVDSKTLIPLNKIVEEACISEDEKIMFECTPNRILLLKDLITQILDDTVFSILQDTMASEHGARMTAMDNATRNANDMIESLTSEYNKKRQAAITTELVEIISGAEVINKQ
jgi:F-type H+-transporting ATPase subunit gamma